MLSFHYKHNHVGKLDSNNQNKQFVPVSMSEILKNTSTMKSIFILTSGWNLWKVFFLAFILVDLHTYIIKLTHACELKVIWVVSSQHWNMNTHSKQDLHVERLSMSLWWLVQHGALEEGGRHSKDTRRHRREKRQDSWGGTQHPFLPQQLVTGILSSISTISWVDNSGKHWLLNVSESPQMLIWERFRIHLWTWKVIFW